MKHKFDVVTASQLLYGPQSTAIFDEMLNFLKRDGLAVFLTRKSCLEENSFQMVIDEISKAYKWKKVKQVNVPVPKASLSAYETGHKDIVLMMFKKV